MPPIVGLIVTFAGSGLLHAIPVVYAGKPGRKHGAFFFRISAFVSAFLFQGAPALYSGMTLAYFLINAVAVVVDSAILAPRKWESLRFILACVAIFAPWTLVAHSLLMCSALLDGC